MAHMPNPDERDRNIAGIEPDEPTTDAADDEDYENGQITEDEDGGATLTLPDDESQPTAFADNLADKLDDIDDIVIDLLEKIERDQESRKKRDEQYEEGLRRTGLGDDAPGGAKFEGASTVVHPVLAEGCVDFAASSSKEILPAAGPVKIAVKGKQDQKQLERAKSKRDYLNHLLTQGIQEYYPEKKTMLTQLPLGGSQYEKYYYEDGEYHMEFVPVDKVHLPFAATSFYTAGRITHEIELTEDEFEARVESGQYIEIENLKTEQVPEQSAAESANDKIEGRDPTIYNEDGLRTLYEVTCYWKVKGDEHSKGARSPYVITIDKATEQCLGFYRNWYEGDQKRKRLDWWVEDRFITWRGAYGIGLPHLIGSMSGAITGALRALLDSAHINNTPAMLKAKQGRVSGTNTVVDPTGVTEVEMGTIDDIRKIAMPMPYNQPSPVLYQLMEFLINNAKGVVATAEEKIADASNQMPVGTALALIEQGSKVFSSIHQGLHFSQAKGLKIICRMVHDYPNAQELQQYGLTPDDFAENTDIEPCSDPNIFSEAQRYAQWQSVMQMSADQSVPYNKIELHRRGLELLRWPDIDSILPPPPPPITADPVTENYSALLQGAKLKADPQQDHVAHLIEHVRILMDPAFGGGPLFKGPQLMPILQHCSEHMVMLYKKDVFKHSAEIGVHSAMSGMQPGMMNPDQVAAQAAMMAMKEFHSGPLGEALKELGQAADAIQKMMPPPPSDPGQIQLQIAQAETARKQKADDANTQLEQKRLDFETQTAIKTLQAELSQQAEQFQADMKAARDKLMTDMLAMKQTEQQANDNFLLGLMKLDKENAEGQADAAMREDQIANKLQAFKQAVGMMPAMPDIGPHLQRLAETQQGLTDAQKQTHEGLNTVMQAVQALHQAQQRRPNKIVRDPRTGDAIGMTYDPSLETPQ